MSSIGRARTLIELVTVNLALMPLPMPPPFDDEVLLVEKKQDPSKSWVLAGMRNGFTNNLLLTPL